MGKQSDTDNRANQLNPNNTAYVRSRGWHRYSEGDLEPVVASAQISEQVLSHRLPAEPLVLPQVWRTEVTLAYLPKNGEEGRVTVESTSRADYAAAFEALWLTGKFLWLYANNHGTVFIDKGQAPAIQVLSGEMPLVQSWMLTRRSIELTALASFNF